MGWFYFADQSLAFKLAIRSLAPLSHFALGLAHSLRSHSLEGQWAIGKEKDKEDIKDNEIGLVTRDSFESHVIHHPLPALIYVHLTDVVLVAQCWTESCFARADTTDPNFYPGLSLN